MRTYYIVHKPTRKVMDIFIYPTKNGTTYQQGTWSKVVTFYGKLYGDTYLNYWVTSDKKQI